MIGMLRGKVWEVQPEGVILDVQGVGYLLTVSLGLLAKVREGQDLVLYTHVIARDDDLSCYGFLGLEEKRLFLLMLSVSGIGPKASLAVLSTYNPGEIQSAIASENVGLLTKVPGIGKKTAQRLILELKEKFNGPLVSTSKNPVEVQRGDSDALETLLALGYTLAESRQALGQANQAGAELNTEDQIKGALRLLAKGAGSNG